jgi:hypothetical protein
MASKPTGWVPNPSLYILMFEPPARSYSDIWFNDARTHVFQHWHFAGVPPGLNGQTSTSTDTPTALLPSDSRKFFSPILFTDGHVAGFNFSRHLKSDPEYDFEPTRDWMWYKPQ